MSLCSSVKGNFLVSLLYRAQQTWKGDWNKKQRTGQQEWEEGKFISPWKQSEGPVWGRLFKGPRELASLHWGCFSKVKMKVLKPSEDKSWICAEIVVENCGITVAKILWFFFFHIKLDGSFGKADTFLGTCQLLKGVTQFFAICFSFEGLHGKVINESIIPDQWVFAVLVNVLLCVSSTHTDIWLLFFFCCFGSSFCWNCVTVSEKIFWGQKTWG